MVKKIYLRSIKKKHKNHLAMFDTNGDGDIDDLTTWVYRGDTVIWKLDCYSGIKSITKISTKNGDLKIFKSEPSRLLLCKGFRVQISESATDEEKEDYTIEYILNDKDETKVVIDPSIMLAPPIRPIPPDPIKK